MTSLLGIGLGDSLESAQSKLKAEIDPTKPPKETGGGEEDADEQNDNEKGHRILFELSSGDYSSLLIALDEKERIKSIAGFIRPGKEIAFDKIGDTKKAPIHNATVTAWDVLRPGRPLSRVVAKGAANKASSIAIFVVPRPAT